MRILAALIAAAAACKETPRPAASPTGPAPIALPAAPPVPAVPSFFGEVHGPPENPVTPEKVQLGHMLFFDKRLSKDGSMSCAGCHHIDKAYTDGRARSPKVGGAINKRNAPTMANLGQHQHGYYWDGRAATLEAVSEAAWKGQLGADPATAAAALDRSAGYHALFVRAFKEGVTARNVPMALASFFRALHSGDSAWDRFEKGEKTAVSEEAQKGFEVFRKAECALCHVPPLYTDTDFHAVGIGADDRGRMDATKSAEDEGKFKTPSLRDVAKTGPYFHDGSATTLEEAIEVMLRGGAQGKKVDAKLKPHQLTEVEKRQLKAFLESLDGQLSIATAPALP